MHWNELNSLEKLEMALKESERSWVLIFKHSISCPISSMAKNRLERSWPDNVTVRPYYLDLIRFREISDAVAAQLGIVHESPQAILLKDGKAVYHSSHMGIAWQPLLEHIKN